MELIFLKPVLKEKIWGGDKLEKLFGMDIPSNNTGEAWVISGHENGVTEVISPPKYLGIGLDKLYAEKKEIFYGNNFSLKGHDRFPLLIKILDANDKLSVQVHPDDDYARKNIGQYELGKNECWYILVTEEGSEIVYGHITKNKDEFVNLIKKQEYDRLLRRVGVQKGDFFNVPSGTIHAIGSGIVILETQQSSDTTFRVYDYDRIDDNGKKRDLHIEESIEVANVPHIDNKEDISLVEFDGGMIRELLSSQYFDVKKIEVDTGIDYEMEKNFLLMTVIEGSGSIEVNNCIYEINKGDSFIIPYGKKRVSFKGSLVLIQSSVK